jgi:hypothetical protein
VEASTLSPALDFYGVDFANPEHWVRIYIYPADRRVNQGRPIVLAFIPGNTCQYGDRRACVTAYTTASGAEVTFLSIHSGSGGEAEAFRQAVEGAGLHSPGYTLKKARSNLAALTGAEVVIVQGKRRTTGFRLAAARRIPAGRVQAYFEQPASAALTFAAEQEPGLQVFVDPSEPLLVFETCGWKMPGEPGAQGLPAASASAYIVVIEWDE